MTNVKRMLIQSTSDVSLDTLRQQATQLPEEWGVVVDDSQMFFKAMEAPSWVSIVATAPWWAQFLAASVSVYISGIISEAGKDTWRNRKKISASISNAPTSAIRSFAKFIASAAEAGNSQTYVTLAIPFPDEYNTAHLKLQFASPEELEFLIALFIAYLPTLETLWKEEGLIEHYPVGGMSLQFGDDCSMLVTWLDARSLTAHDRVLQLTADL